MIIKQNCCNKLVLLVIFIYDARSHVHEIEYLKFRKLLKNRSRLIRDTEDTRISKSACLIIQRGCCAFVKDLFHPR